MISKSGTTTEPAIAFRVFRELLISRYGEKGAARLGIDIIVLPEYADMTFCPETREEYVQAHEENTGRLLQKAAETAKRLGAFVFVNASDLVNGEYLNTTFAFDRAGELRGKYLKPATIFTSTRCSLGSPRKSPTC